MELVLLVVLVVVIESSIMTVSCRPSEPNEFTYKVHQDVGQELVLEEEEEEALNSMELAGIQRCEDDENQMELCARCTKAAKARNVYPMCCLNEDGVGDWCRDFVYFGIQ